MPDVSHRLGPVPGEEALDVVPVGLLAVEHGGLHHHGQPQLCLVDLLLALLAAGAV